MPEPYGFVLRLLIGTGLRWSEACRAVAHRRGPEDTVFIEDGSIVVSQTKTGRVRRVPLAPGLLAEVRTRIGPLVPYSASNPTAFARLVRRRTGLDGFHVHRCRHTFACAWIERGGSLAALQQCLGHSTVVTTQRYARLSDAAVRDEARRLNEGSAEG
jgi:integrase